MEGEAAPAILLVEKSDATVPFMAHASQIRELNKQLSIREVAEARLDFALNAAGIGIWELDVERDRAWRSPQHDRIFGYAEMLDEWSFEIFLDHVVEEDRQYVRDSFENNVRDGKPWKFECRILRHDGETRWISAEGNPTRNEAGDVTSLNGVVLDITTRKHDEQRLSAALRMEAVGQMAGGLAHDFANIIGTIRLSAQVAKRSDDRQTIDGRIDAILNAAERGASLSARTLAFARRETGTARPVSLGPLVDGLVSLAGSGNADHVEIRASVDEDLCVRCDPGQLENALLNLVLNSREAIASSGVGGRIEISAKRSAQDDTAEVSVSDDGPGMDRVVLSRATDPFFSTKEGSGGSGLGLAMVDNFVRSAGGEIALTSATGEGTTIMFTLPQCAPDRTAADSDDPPRGTPERCRLLLVEDDPHYRTALELTLADLGHDVLAVADGPSALNRLQEEAGFDVLLTDVLLPGGMNGFQLARSAVANHPGLKVIYMSGYADDSDAQGAPEGRFLRKPVGAERIDAALCEVLLTNDAEAVES